MGLDKCPTDPITTFDPEDQDIGEFYEAYKRGSTDFIASNLRKGQSGNFERRTRLLTVLTKL